MPKNIDRFNKYKGNSVDSVIAKIISGEIECGRMLDKMDINDKKIFDGKEIFKNADYQRE